ncbi:YidH family protein [Salinisphaera hydrothermalis]|uniref:YidH family protein n=1 Tax=Salinisphaera hydrothermalis TaxID=563188 RepID=UPI0033429734
MTNRDRDTAAETPDHEPDYRFTLANERTFLAWIRTALALLAGSVVIVQLVPDLGIPEARQAIAAVLAIISMAVVAGSALRWHASQKAMRFDAPLPSTLMPWLLALGVIVVGLIIMLLVLIYGVKTSA